MELEGDYMGTEGGMKTIANYTEKFSATCSHKCVTLARFKEGSHIQYR